MRRVTITIQILSSRTAQRVSKNLEAFCKYQVMFQLRQTQGGRGRRRAPGLLPTRSRLSALNLMMLILVSFCLPHKRLRKINQYETPFPDFSISMAF